MDDWMKTKATILKLAVRTEGVAVLDPIEGICETVKEDIPGLYAIDKRKGRKANEIVLHGRITTKLVHNEESRFALFREGDEYFLGRGRETPLLSVGFSKRPRHYGLETSRGTPMDHVAQVMGADCLAIAVDKQCHYFTNGDFCRYCNITPTNLETDIERLSDLDDIRETVAAAQNYRFFDLTGGTFADRDEEIERYIEIGRIIKEETGRERFSGPFSFSPPRTLDKLADLAATGVDAISFNPDIWSEEAFRQLCPGKAKIGKEWYDLALEAARDIWGVSNAVVQYMVGPWETNDELLDGVRYHADRGILTNLTTFFPSPRSTLRNGHPKTLADLVHVYGTFGEIIRDAGLYPNARRSVLTSESANRSSVSNEAAKGYLLPEHVHEVERALQEPLT